MKHTNLLVLTGLALLGSLAACNKDDDDDSTVTPTTPTCRISTVDEVGDSDSTRYTVTYTSDGKVASVNYGGDVSTFSYSGNMVYVSGTGAQKDTITLNADGLVAEVRSNSPANIAYRNQTNHSYNGTEVQRTISTTYFSGGSNADTILYTWSGGNRVSETNDGYTTTYDFYTDKAVPASGGDPFNFYEYAEYGAYVVRNKNLTKRVSYDGDALDVTYEYDQAGKVTKASANGAFGLGYYRYSYVCQ